MLALLFYLKEVMYAIKSEKIKEVVPLVPLKQIPKAPEFFAGFFNYRGQIVPVIDLCQLIQAEPCKKRLSTRIILINYAINSSTPYVAGLMAERVTETIRANKNAFSSSRVMLSDAPYLGQIIMTDCQMIQYIDTDFLPKSIGLLELIQTTGRKQPPAKAGGFAEELPVKAALL